MCNGLSSESHGTGSNGRAAKDEDKANAIAVTRRTHAPPLIFNH